MSRVLEYRARERDLVKATHVCQYWRSTLTSSPTLWSCSWFHTSPDFDRILTYLERSKSAPIDVNINTSCPDDLDIVKYFIPHIARTRSLIICESYTQPVSFLFCNPAPSLQRLEIHALNKDFVCLPENFLGQQPSSLRFVSFNGICPTFETFFPLPNLTEFHLYLHRGMGPFSMSALFRFFSDSPLLQKVYIGITGQTIQDIPLDQVISLESLVELEYTHNLGDRVLPYLRLPRLKQFRVLTSIEPGEVQRLADILPYDGSILLAGVTRMSYYSDARSLRVDLSGNEVGVSFVASCTIENPSVDWFSDQTCIPFGQIEDLEVDGHSTDMNFHVNALVFENLRVLRIIRWERQLSERLLRMLHPDLGTGVPCRSLRKIECTCWTSSESLLRSLASLVKKRKRAGHRLELVCLPFVQESNQDLMEELREHVGEVLADDMND